MQGCRSCLAMGPSHPPFVPEQVAAPCFPGMEKGLGARVWVTA